MAKLLYFGRLSDVTGATAEDLQLPDTIATAGQLRSWLDLRFEANGALLEPTVRIAVNSELCFDSTELSNADEIAFMPPVGGG
ncbi:MAG: MoaD/ThiS family protein [Pseudomonadota bacterium]|nr:MoaD/ThiS family protein [Pseudomonadota bacterium]